MKFLYYILFNNTPEFIYDINKLMRQYTSTHRYVSTSVRQFISTLIILLTLSLNIAHAQLTTGIKLGLTTGTPIGPVEDGATGKLGLGSVAGILAEYQVNDKWRLGIELYYTQKKSTFSTPATVDEYDYLFSPPGTDTMVWIVAEFQGFVDGQFDNRYIEMPILGHYYFSERFGATFGPYFSYLLEGDISGVSTGDVTIGVGTLPVENEVFDESQHLETLDYGLVGGIRYRTNFGMNYELRLTSGLRSVFKDTYPLAEGVVRNIYLQLTAAYKFGKR